MELKVISRHEVLGKNFRIYGTVAEPLFLAKDVASWIEHSDVSTMIRNVDEDEKQIQTLFVSGQKRDAWFLTEDGLYEVLMQSRKAVAKSFKKQVKAILKEIRTTGVYKVPHNPMEAIQLMFKSMNETDAHLSDVENRVSELEDNTPLSPSSYSFINKCIGQRIREYLEAKNIQGSQEAKKLLYKDIGSSINAIAGTATRSQLKAKHFDDVVNFIRDWIPSQVTIYKIGELAHAME